MNRGRNTIMVFWHCKAAKTFNAKERVWVKYIYTHKEIWDGIACLVHAAETYSVAINHIY